MSSDLIELHVIKDEMQMCLRYDHNSLSFELFPFCYRYLLLHALSYSPLYSFSPWLSDPPGCGRPHRAAGDIRPVSSPRGEATSCTWWSCPLLPLALTPASHHLFNCYTSASVPFPGVRQSYILYSTQTVEKCINALISSLCYIAAI